MKARYNNQLISEASTKQLLPGIGLISKETKSQSYFKCLKGNDVITAKVSDHHPMIHDGVLFWNIMMQGKLRNNRQGTSYNNGFGIIETDQQYIKRLMKIADVIAEIIYFNPSIDVITICEGPIQLEHINALLSALKKHGSMRKFFKNFIGHDFFHKPKIDGFPSWGLLMLADKKYSVKDIVLDEINHGSIFSKLANRLHIWALTTDAGASKYLGLGHFPFGGDECVTEKQKLSNNGMQYCKLVTDIIKKFSDLQFTLCADFNFNPYLISEWKDRELDMIRINNSILLTKEEKIYAHDAVTVDGILLSRLEKQRYYGTQTIFGLFNRMQDEYHFAQSSVKKRLVDNRHKNDESQRVYDKQFGLCMR